MQFVMSVCDSQLLMPWILEVSELKLQISILGPDIAVILLKPYRKGFDKQQSAFVYKVGLSKLTH